MSPAENPNKIRIRRIRTRHLPWNRPEPALAKCEESVWKQQNIEASPSIACRLSWSQPLEYGYIKCTGHTYKTMRMLTTHEY